MTTSPGVIAQPDLEAHVYAQLAGLRGVTSFCYAAIHGWPPWLVTYSIQADARAVSKEAARDLAERVRLILAALPEVPWPDGVVSYVQPVEGPFWLPDPEDGGPRYVARYEIRVHPARSVPGSPAPPMGSDRAARNVPPGTSEGTAP
jgi:hypothetical protein